MKTHAEPIGGPLLTKPFLGLAALFGVACAVILWRFAFGIGAVSALSDGFPWGIWIAFDVVTGTALACGGYAVAILVYVLNKGRFHPLVRPAILTSALGYTVAGLSLAVDVGRPWTFWRVPIFFTEWNFNSALLEVALCIMSYIGVLWIELSPAFLERWKDAEVTSLRRFARAVLPLLDKYLVWIIALGLLLPTMHQSSLGTLMILTGWKLHAFWQTPLLPLLFLLSCMVMGYSVVVFESSLANWLFGRKPETRMLSALSGAMVTVIFIFLGVRVFDLAWRGQVGAAFTSGRHSLMLAGEFALLLAPAILLMSRATRGSLGGQFRAAMLMMLAGALYRFDAFLIAYNPGDNWSYFPSIGEMTITLGLVALEIMAYVVIVRNFPVLGGMGGVSPAVAGQQGVQ
ncbi:MAG TPA: Ni/Fe-hydrogenase cytochrome b subunit [Candidatus Polarisedimenticolia bacterium]|nr:Ni/Fe-hydrogenase cytochrome b subunit [Candidatus Polarisedimenticolia bacterium]